MWGLKYGENAVIEDDWFITSELVASFITTHQRSCRKVMFSVVSVCLSHVSITNDTLDLTLQGHFPQTYIEPYCKDPPASMDLTVQEPPMALPSPAPLTCSNLFNLSTWTSLYRTRHSSVHVQSCS